MANGTERGMRPRAERRTLFPWMLVGAGALVYWTIALGIGIPSLADVLGAPRAVHRPALDARCVTDVSAGGRPYAFHDCVDVRLMLDSPELARPPHTVPRHAPRVRLAPMPDTVDPLYAGPDPEVQELRRQRNPDPLDSVGRTAY